MQTRKKHPASGNTVIALCALIYFVSYFARKDFAAVMAGIIANGLIDKAMGGVIGMGLFISYGIGQLISGYLGDKLKPKTLLISGLGVTALCNLAMPLVPSTTLMIPVWALNGLAQAMLWPPIVRILADNLDHARFITANLLVCVSAHISTILLYLYVPLCLEYFDWKTVFYTATVIAVVVLALLILSLCFVILDKSAPFDKERHPSPTEVPQAPQIGIVSLFTRAGLIPILFGIIMMGFLRDGIEAWLPTLYGEAFGRTATESVLVSAILPLLSIIFVVAITVAHKSRLFANETRGSAILFGCGIALCIPLAILINFEQSALRLLCLILAALVCGCMHSINFLFISCLPGRFASYGKAATVSGFCNACTYVGAAISMYGIAAVAEHLGWSATVISWIGVALLGMLFALLAYRRYTKFIRVP